MFQVVTAIKCTPWLVSFNFSRLWDIAHTNQGIAILKLLYLPIWSWNECTAFVWRDKIVLDVSIKVLQHIKSGDIGEVSLTVRFIESFLITTWRHEMFGVILHPCDNMFLYFRHSLIFVCHIREFFVGEFSYFVYPSPCGCLFIHHSSLLFHWKIWIQLKYFLVLHKIYCWKIEYIYTFDM